MADLKISQLPASTIPLDGTEVLPLVQSSTTKKVSVDNLTANKVTKVTSTDNAIVRFDGTSGNVQNTAATIDDSGLMTIPVSGGTANVTGLTISRNTDTLNDGVSISLSTNGRTSGIKHIQPGGGVGRLYLSVQGNDQVQVDYDGLVTVLNNNLKIGTSGKGIDFSVTASGSGTMTSELLADYEEGEWNPTVTSSVGAITSYTATGTYTKIGRLVTVFAVITITNVGTGSGGILVAGLPWAVTSSAIGTGRDVVASGYLVSASYFNSEKLYVANYNNTFPVTTNSKVVMSAQYYA